MCVCVPTTIILSGSSWEEGCCSKNNLWFLNNVWAYNFLTGNKFKTQVITGRPHLYAEKISPTAFLRLAHAQHVFVDYICCLQLHFDCTHCIPELSCKRWLHRTCCSVGASFNKKSVFSAVSVIPDINQCQYTTLKIVWACSTFRQP